MNETTLVTGAAGFIGSHVCRDLLDQGYHVIGVDNFDPFYDSALKRAALAELIAFENFSFAEVDVRDTNTLLPYCEDVSSVVHLAARAGVRHSIDDPLLYYSINTGGTVSLLEACRKANVRRVVFGSSSSVYGNDTPTPFDEGAPCAEPVSPYAASKRAAELQCRVYSQLHGFRIACLRFFTVYGPGQRPDLAIHRFTRLMVEDKPIPQFGDGSSERDYTWVKDVAAGVRLAVEWTAFPTASMEIFNLGANNPVRLDRIIQLIATAVGVRPEIEKQPEAKGDVQRTYADISKARRVLNYEPRVRVEDGIPMFVKWFDEVSGRVPVGR